VSCAIPFGPSRVPLTKEEAPVRGSASSAPQERSFHEQGSMATVIQATCQSHANAFLEFRNVSPNRGDSRSFHFFGVSGLKFQVPLSGCSQDIRGWGLRRLEPRSSRRSAGKRVNALMVRGLRTGTNTQGRAGECRGAPGCRRLGAEGGICTHVWLPDSLRRGFQGRPLPVFRELTGRNTESHGGQIHGRGRCSRVGESRAASSEARAVAIRVSRPEFRPTRSGSPRPHLLGQLLAPWLSGIPVSYFKGG